MFFPLKYIRIIFLLGGKLMKIFPLKADASSAIIYHGYICFSKSSFRETIFQIFLCLFVIRKVGQRKHFSVNEKHFLVKEKFGLVSKKIFSLLTMFVFRKVVSGKPLSKLSCVCLPLEKLVNGKHFPVKEKFGLVLRKVFSWKI